MDIRKIQDGEFEGKKVLVRVDFNVELANGDVKEKFKIRAARKTVDFLQNQKDCKIALMSHLGRPDGSVVEKYSLKQIADDVERILEKKVVFVADCVGEKVKTALENLGADEILLMENVRFYPGEETNDAEFAGKLAENFDVFIGDAFGVSHRDQASVTGITKYLESYAGFWLQEEIKNLNYVMHEPDFPSTAIIGGAKIETKLPLIKKFEEKYTHILVGGKIANEVVDEGLTFSPKVILPIDYAEDRQDIGPKTIQRFKEIISISKIIVWNGPMGKFEDAPFDKGTREILDAVVESDAFTLIGGGESVEVLEENGLMEKISFVSTGGGAMLEYLSGNVMPGIEALRLRK